MKLYFSPGACSLSPHIVLQEAGYTFDLEKVDLKTHRTHAGVALAHVSGKNYVPILELENGERLTEGPVIVQYLADGRPEADLIPKAGSFERYRVQEWLNFITSELHKTFTPLFHRDTTSKDWQEAAEHKLAARFEWLSAQLAGRSYLVGDRFTVADAYLFTVLNWCNFVSIDLKRWPTLDTYVARIVARPAVQRAMKAEGLAAKAAAA
jgi:glutathione S-transferase